ncbi:hypothetical protein KIN20_028102 [Parelaphostrongylus tenuis]|uniref:Uncharacterized protein n=1 Tax=Parelaphostrongylus tenuis TaxID=148309 RepID=A0AAD5WEJ0_PARTN|nr:hypothetical protein KIN20_028102 [Parelaphostrongylus tenuis]
MQWSINFSRRNSAIRSALETSKNCEEMAIHRVLGYSFVSISTCRSVYRVRNIELYSARSNIEDIAGKLGRTEFPPILSASSLVQEDIDNYGFSVNGNNTLPNVGRCSRIPIAPELDENHEVLLKDRDSSRFFVFVSATSLNRTHS